MLKSTRWFERSDSPNWVVDSSGVVLGYVDDLGRTHYLPGTQAANDIVDGSERLEAASTYRYGASPYLKSAASGDIILSQPVFAVVPTAGTEINYAEQLRQALQACRSGQTLMLPAATDTLKFINCGGERIKVPSNVHVSSHGSILLNAILEFSPTQRQLKNSKVHDMEMKGCKAVIEETMVSGTSTGGNAAFTLNDTAANWTPDKYSGQGTRGWWYVRIKSGTGTGQTKRIAGNTGTQLTVSSAWTVNGGVIPDETSEYYFFCNVASITFDTVFFDGTNLSEGGTTAGNAIEIGNYAFNIRVLNCQGTHYAGWAYAMYGNSDKVGNAGTANLGTGVYNIIDNTEFVNCGSGAGSMPGTPGLAGSGGGILLMGGPQDGATLHMSKVLLDGNQYNMYVDDSVNGVKETPSAGSGGITVLASNMRSERGGRLSGGSVETSSIVNVRGNINIDGLWIGTHLTAPLGKNIWNKSGKFSAKGGRSTTPSTIYDVYCDPYAIADWDVEMSNPRTIGAMKTVKANANNSCELEFLRIRIKRLSATSVSFTFLTDTSGWGWGAGSAAGDRWSNTETGPSTIGDSTSASAGSGFSTVYGLIGSGGGTFKFTLSYKEIARVLMCSIAGMDAGLTNVYAEAQLLNGTASFTILFKDNLNVEKNIVSLMADGKWVDVQVGIAISR